jgi:uncharacterized RDD family membrane protein YckC
VAVVAQPGGSADMHTQTPEAKPISGFDVNPYEAPVADVDAAPSAGLAGAAPLADRGTRLGAAVIDGTIGSGVAMPGMVLLALVGDPVLGMILLALPLLAFAVYQMYLIATQGATLGKRWLRIKIIKMDGSPVHFGDGVALRMWVPGVLGAIPGLGAVFGIADLLFIFGKQRRCLHDHIAGTKVIVAPGPSLT